MFNVKEKFRNIFGIEEEYENDEFENEDEMNDDYYTDETINVGNNARRANVNSGVVNFPTNAVNKMVIYKPANFVDAQNIIDNLKSRKPVIINLEALEDARQAQRTLDFIAGAIYAIDGTIKKIALNVFVVAPINYDVISGDDSAEDNTINYK